ncbi:hypothetical protein [Candidatus Nitrosotalea okcheonensis]|nr:hypothetical protein [Candidatus Nitrosotalea okcheonensis]
MKDIFTISLLTILLTVTMSYVYGESSAAPVVITKVELWSPPTFAEGVNMCDGSKALEPWTYQWIEINNTRNEPLTLNNFSLNMTGSNLYLHNYVISLPSHGSCLFQTANEASIRVGLGGSQGNGQPNGYDGSSVIIQYTVQSDKGISKYKDSTPRLSDTYGDTRIWQLIDGKWLFKEFSIPDVDRTTLTKTTDGGSIMVNLTLAQEIQPPTMSKFKINFMDGEKNPLRDVKYEITYDGANQVEQGDNGFATNGTAIKFMEFTEPGPLKITINILGIDNKTLDKPQSVDFSTVTVPEFPFAIPILMVSITSLILLYRIKFKTNI